TLEAGAGCCPAGWSLLIQGTRFAPCSSIVLALPSGLVYELLPTPDVSDCAIVRGSSSESPRERMLRLLPPDGESIDCQTAPALVPLRQAGLRDYQHD